MRIAIIGSYGHLNYLLSSAALRTGSSIVAVARYGSDDRLDFVGRSAAAPAATPIFDDYRKMLDEVRPDVVGVFMPLFRNAEASIAAAQRGCHILGEKPLATTLEDLAALRAAVAAADVRIASLMGMRAEAPFQTIRRIVAAGTIGRPVLAYGQKSYPFNQRDDYYKSRRTYGGSIPWQAIHAIDFVSYCAGCDFTRAAAMQSNACHPTHEGMEDNGGVLLEFRGGGHAVISFDYLRPWSAGVKRAWGGDALRVCGTDAMVETIDDLAGVRLTTPTAVEAVPLAPPRDLVAEFIASLEGHGEGLISTAESFRTTEVALLARHAADTGLVVNL